MKKRRLFFLVVILLLVGAYFTYNYLYQDHRDIKTEDSVIEITAEDLLQQFKSGTAASILNNTITVTGTISQIEEMAVTLNNSVHCSFDGGLTGLVDNEEIKIKGRCIGYDDLFEVVKLDQCSITK